MRTIIAAGLLKEAFCRFNGKAVRGVAIASMIEQQKKTITHFLLCHDFA